MANITVDLCDYDDFFDTIDDVFAVNNESYNTREIVITPISGPVISNYDLNAIPEFDLDKDSDCPIDHHYRDL